MHRWICLHEKPKKEHLQSSQYDQVRTEDHMSCFRLPQNLFGTLDAKRKEEDDTIQKTVVLVYLFYQYSVPCEQSYE
jgi:capsid portal protein